MRRPSERPPEKMRVLIVEGTDGIELGEKVVGGGCSKATCSYDCGRISRDSVKTGKKDGG